MKQLGKINPDLTPAHRIAIEAGLSKTIKESKNDELGDAIISMLGEACELLGQKANGLAPTAKLLRDELKNYFSTYTIEEVRIAVNMGVTEKLIPHKDLSVPLVSIVNICKFIHAYNDIVRKEARHQQAKYQTILTEEEEKRRNEVANAMLDREIDFCYENYIGSPETLNLVSDVLKACYFNRIREKNKEFSLGKEMMDQILLVAEGRHKTFEQLDLVTRKQMERERTVEKWNVERDSEVKATARAIALKYAFDNIKEKENDK